MNLAQVISMSCHRFGSKPAIIVFCERHLANYKCPKEIIFMDQLPRNTMGKIQKDMLRKNYFGK